MGAALLGGWNVSAVGVHARRPALLALVLVAGPAVAVGAQDVHSAAAVAEPIVLGKDFRFPIRLGPTQTVAFSGDGCMVAVGYSDNRAVLWRADGSGRPLLIEGIGEPRAYRAVTEGGTAYDDYETHTMSMIAFSRDGSKVMWGLGDGTARLCPTDGQAACTVVPSDGLPVLDSRANAEGEPSSIVAISESGRKLARGAEDGTLRTWSVYDDEEPLRRKAHREPILAVAISPDGRAIATGSYDKTARIWKANHGRTPVVLTGHRDAVRAVAFSRDGRKVITGSLDGTARIWNADGSGQPVVLKGHEQAITSVAFSPDGRKVATGSWDMTARVWNADGSGEPLVLAHPAPDGGHVIDVAFSPDGSKLAVAAFWKPFVWQVSGQARAPARRSPCESVRPAGSGRNAL